MQHEESVCASVMSLKSFQSRITPEIPSYISDFCIINVNVAADITCLFAYRRRAIRAHQSAVDVQDCFPTLRLHLVLD